MIYSIAGPGWTPGKAATVLVQDVTHEVTNQGPGELRVLVLEPKRKPAAAP